MRAARSQPCAMSFTRLGPEQRIRETEAGGGVTPRASRRLLSVQRPADRPAHGQRLRGPYAQPAAVTSPVSPSNSELWVSGTTQSMTRMETTLQNLDNLFFIYVFIYFLNALIPKERFL